MFNLATKEDVRILHRRIDELTRHAQALESYCDKVAAHLIEMLDEINKGSLDKMTFHGKAIKKGGKKRD